MVGALLSGPITENLIHDVTERGVHIMTCKIDRVVGPDEIVVLQISGRIDGPDVEILRELMENETTSKSTVALDLRNVTLISRAAIKLLSTVEEKGTELRNCPAYIRLGLARETLWDYGNLTGRSFGWNRKETYGKEAYW